MERTIWTSTHAITEQNYRQECGTLILDIPEFPYNTETMTLPTCGRWKRPYTWNATQLTGDTVNARNMNQLAILMARNKIMEDLYMWSNVCRKQRLSDHKTEVRGCSVDGSRVLLEMWHVTARSRHVVRPVYAVTSLNGISGTLPIVCWTRDVFNVYILIGAMYSLVCCDLVLNMGKVIVSEL